MYGFPYRLDHVCSLQIIEGAADIIIGIGEVDLDQNIVRYDIHQLNSDKR